jgi:hypothetical protein
MSLRDTMQDSAAPYLKPEETVQAVFGGQTASPYMAPIIGVVAFLGLNSYRIFVVTDERILVLNSGTFSMKKAKGVVAELPRSTRLGPASGVWHAIRVNGDKIRVHRRFFSDIEAADNAAPAPA